MTRPSPGHLQLKSGFKVAIHETNVRETVLDQISQMRLELARNGGCWLPAVRRPAQGRATDGTGLNMLMAASFRT